MPETPPTTLRRRFGPSPASLFAVLIFFLGSLPVASLSLWFLPVLLVPVVCGVWVLRARVVADEQGLAVSNGLAITSVPWTEVEGLDATRLRPVLLRRRDARPLAMTALSRRDVPALLEVARAAGRRASASSRPDRPRRQ